MRVNRMTQGLLAGLSAAGSTLAALLGGWDASLQALVVFMAADYASGLLVAGVFKASPKTATGALDSRVGFRGLLRKGAMLLLVLVAVRLGMLVSDGGWLRDAVILFFCANEGLSVLENIGLMGVKYPGFLTEMLEALKKQEK